MGQPITLAKRMILGPAATWRYYAGYAGKVAGESYPPDEDGMYKIVQYEPLGESARDLDGIDAFEADARRLFSSLRRLCWHMCMERLARSRSLEDGPSHGCWQHFRPQVE
jgi:hypothetical protein